MINAHPPIMVKSRILGINKVKTKAAGIKLKKPIECAAAEYAGRVVTGIQYI